RRMEVQNEIWRKMKRRLQNYKPYVVASEIKGVLEKHFKKADNVYGRVVSLKPEKPSQGNVLLSIWNEPFLLNPGQSGANAYHSHYWESLEIAKTFLDLGYSVDVINYHNTEFLPEKDYSFLVDERWNLERLASLLSNDCVKIMHLD